jgi:uncharacterized protein YPO0396
VGWTVCDEALFVLGSTNNDKIQKLQRTKISHRNNFEIAAMSNVDIHDEIINNANQLEKVIEILKARPEMAKVLRTTMAICHFIQPWNLAGKASLIL